MKEWPRRHNTAKTNKCSMGVFASPPDNANSPTRNNEMPKKISASGDIRSAMRPAMIVARLDAMPAGSNNRPAADGVRFNTNCPNTGNAYAIAKLPSPNTMAKAMAAAKRGSVNSEKSNRRLARECCDQMNNTVPPTPTNQ